MIKMKKNALHRKWRALLALSTCILFYACSMETEGGMLVEESEAEVELNLEFAGDGRSTRSMTYMQEQAVSEVHVLIFDEASKDLVDVRTTKWVNGSNNGKTKTFMIFLPRGVFDLMILANSGEAIEAAGLQPGMPKNQVMEELTLSQAGKWNANSTHPDLIPFWGERTHCVIQENYSSIDGITMLRALSRIDIEVVGEAKTIFKLETVSLYHWQQEMCLIPAHYDAGNEIVTKATASNSGLIPATAPMQYTEGDLTTADVAIEAVIYVNETPSPGVSSFPVLPCLVVGGKVDGQRRYYRIDFNQIEDGQDKYYDLLRNYRYQFQITGIITNGFDNEKDAYESVPVGLEWQVHIWEEGNMENIMIDGNQWLRVEPGKFLFPKNEHLTPGQNVTTESSGYTSYIFPVETNVAGGWRVKDDQISYTSGQQSWLKLSSMSGDENTISQVEMFVNENTTNSSRHASFVIVAGDIEYKVTVEQTAAELAFISVTGAPGNKLENISFNSNSSQYQYFMFVLEWFPSDWNCTVQIEDIPGYDPLTIFNAVGYDLEIGEISGGRKVYDLGIEGFYNSPIGKTYASKFVFKVGKRTAKLEVFKTIIP